MVSGRRLAKRGGDGTEPGTGDLSASNEGQCILRRTHFSTSILCDAPRKQNKTSILCNGHLDLYPARERNTKKKKKKKKDKDNKKKKNKSKS